MYTYNQSSYSTDHKNTINFQQHGIISKIYILLGKKLKHSIIVQKSGKIICAKKVSNRVGFTRPPINRAYKRTLEPGIRIRISV